MIVFALRLAGGVRGYQAYQMRKQAEEMEKAMRAMNEGAGLSLLHVTRCNKPKRERQVSPVCDRP